MWLLDANMDAHLVSILTGFKILLRYRGEARMEGPFERRSPERGRGRGLSLPAHTGPALRQIRFACLKDVSALRSCGRERPTAALGSISRTVPRAVEGTSHRADSRPLDSVAMTLGARRHCCAI